MEKFEIRSALPDNVTGGAIAPEPSALSAEEVRNCFAGDVCLHMEGHGEIGEIALTDVPIVGLLVDLTEAWSHIRDGAESAAFVDFYGEYRIVLSLHGGKVRCLNEFTGQSVSVDATTFHVALRSWSAGVFVESEDRFAGLRESKGYQRLKRYVTEILAKRPARE